MLFNVISYLQLWQPNSLELNHLCNFGSVQHKEQFCEVILNLNQWFRRCHLKTFLIKSSGGPFCLLERNHLCNFGRVNHMEHLCEIILNLVQ